MQASQYKNDLANVGGVLKYIRSTIFKPSLIRLNFFSEFITNIMLTVSFIINFRFVA